MKIGICCPTFDMLDWAKDAGFDYIEPNFTLISVMDEKELDEFHEKVKSLGFETPVSMGMFPKDVRITGDVDWVKVENHIKKGFANARKLGVKTIVFGSGGAKQVQDGFSFDEAWEQLVKMLKLANPIAVENDITIVIEALNRQECNIINNMEEVARLAKDADCSNVKVLYDYYHSLLEGEDISVLDSVKDDLVHVHFAVPPTRTYPTEVCEEHKAFIEKLRSIGYDKNISMECRMVDKHADMTEKAPIAYKIFKGYCQ